MNTRILTGTLALAALASSLRADVTIDVQVGPIGDVGATGFLVADVDGNGFSPAGPWLTGNAIAPGQRLGSTDDVIVAVFETSASPWPAGTGFAEVLSGIDLARLGVAPGAALQILWIATPGQANTALVSNTAFFRHRSGNFTVPSDGASGKLVALSNSLGGSFDSTAVGEESTGGEAVDLAINESAAAMLGSEETMFFRFDHESGSGLHVETEGESFSGEVFDAFGNSVGPLEEFEGDIPEGMYYIALTGDSGGGEAPVEVRVVEVEYRPDLWTQSRGNRGDNIYSRRVTRAQSYSFVMQRRKLVRFKVSLENDAFIEDTLKAVATQSKRGFRETIVQGSTGANVTSDLMLGRFILENMAEKSSESLYATVKAKRKHKGKQVQTFSLQSQSDRSRIDVNQVRVISR